MTINSLFTVVMFFGLAIFSIAISNIYSYDIGALVAGGGTMIFCGVILALNYLDPPKQKGSIKNNTLRVPKK